MQHYTALHIQYTTLCSMWHYTVQHVTLHCAACNTTQHCTYNTFTVCDNMQHLQNTLLACDTPLFSTSIHLFYMTLLCSTCLIHYIQQLQYTHAAHNTTLCCTSMTLHCAACDTALCRMWHCTVQHATPLCIMWHYTVQHVTLHSAACDTTRCSLWHDTYKTNLQCVKLHYAVHTVNMFSMWH